MAVLNDRAMGIMDFISRAGADLITPPNASPVFRPTSPMQQAMGRPQVQMSQDGGQMATMMPSGDIAMASPAMPTMGAQMGAPRPSIPDMGGAGVRMTQPQLMEQAAKAKQLIDRTGGEIEKDPSFRSTVQEFFGNRENMLRLALGFNTMRLTPDQGLAAVIGDELKEIRTTRSATSQRNRTADALERLNPQLAQAVREGMDPKTAIEMYQAERKGVVVGKKIINPYTAQVIYDGTGTGEDLPDAMKTLLARAKEAGLQPGTQEYQQFMINGGQRSGISLKVGADGTIELTEGGAGSTFKLTDSQSNALAFGGRMQTSNQILSQMETQGTDLRQRLAEGIPLVGNYLLTPEYQQYSQAKRDFVNAVLRKESGAAIAASEFENADKQYFPQPGDSPQVIEQKRKNRTLAAQLMMAGVPIKGLSQDPRQVLQGTVGSIPRPANIAQEIWDEIPAEEKLRFK
jgi:hypothetical protein